MRCLWMPPTVAFTTEGKVLCTNPMESYCRERVGAAFPIRFDNFLVRASIKYRCLSCIANAEKSDVFVENFPLWDRN